MKILKLRFKNINSLKGEHLIDFREKPFRSNALFAITGPTGSGKSTLLDVITLALYNKIPRIDQGISKAEIEKKGAILTRGQKEAFAEVTYSCKRGEFLSRWEISTARTGNLRDYEMKLSEAITGKIISERKSDVPDLNQDYVGLEYEQFIRSVLLAQGDFAKFLQVNKKDRSALLEKITGLDIYRQIGMRVYQKAKGIRIDINRLKEKIEERKGDLLDKFTVDKLKVDVNTLTSEIKKNEEQAKSLNINIERSKELKKQEENHSELLKDKEALTTKIISFNKNDGQSLSNHEKVVHLQNDLVEYKRLQAEESSLTKKQSDLEQQLRTREKIVQEILSHASTLTKQELSDDTLVLVLENLERKVNILDNDLDKERSRYNALLNEMRAIARPFSIPVSKEIAIMKAGVLEMADSASKIVEKTENHIDQITFANIEIILDQLDKEQKTLAQAEKLNLDIDYIQKTVAEEKNDLTSLEELLKELPQQLKTIEEAIEFTKKEFEILKLRENNRILEAKLESHRNSLQEGEPCPVCGSCQHPYVEHYKVKENRSKDLTEKEKELSDFKSQLAVIVSKQNSANEKSNSLQKSIARHALHLQQKISLFKEKYKWKLGSDWDELGSEISRKQELVKQYVKASEILDAIDQINPKINILEQYLANGKSLQKQRQNLYSGKENLSELVKKLKNAWHKSVLSLANTKNSWKDVNEKRANIRGSLEAFEKQLNSSIQQLEIPSIQWANDALLLHEKYQDLRRIKSKLIESTIKLESSIEKSAKDIEALRLRLGNIDLDQFIEKKEVLDTINSKHKQELDNAKHRLKNQEANETKITRYQEELKLIQKENKYWILLDNLLGDASGHKFNTFAQELTLIQLLQRANRRLSSLNQRYIIANPTQGEDDSLTIIDQDMGGQRRSVRTLSGGETFVISLALALALSDLASLNVRIDSMFIDEGFGTLDSEILDQILDSLERLQQDGSKMIGIISHVSSLKERIATQIQINQNGRGYSSIEIV